MPVLLLLLQQALLSRPRQAFCPGSPSSEAFLHLFHSANALAVSRINAERGEAQRAASLESLQAANLMLALELGSDFKDDHA